MDADAPSADAPSAGGPGAGTPVPDAVEFYWRPGCPFCTTLRRGLRRRGVVVREHNIWEDPDAAAVVRAAAGGNETVPTVVVAGRALVNPGSGRVERLVAEVAPHLLRGR